MYLHHDGRVKERQRVIRIKRQRFLEQGEGRLFIGEPEADQAYDEVELKQR